MLDAAGSFSVGSIRLGRPHPLVAICGPCVIEGEEATLAAAEALAKLFAAKGIPLIFKSSYDKANRSSIDSYRGPGLDKGLAILQRVKVELGLPLITDVHSPEEARAAAEVCDLVQIPAFLCRQTDLLVAAAETQAAVAIKKGQFMAPDQMGPAVEKVRSTGNERVLLIERGATFGYHNLVCDMRSLAIMRGYGVPVCFDATHAVQLPGGMGSYSGGEKQYIPLLARAAVAAGVDAIFIEAHPEPEKALSDSATQLPFSELSALLDQLKAIYELLWRHESL